MISDWNLEVEKDWTGIRKNKKDFTSYEMGLHECRLSPTTAMKRIIIPSEKHQINLKGTQNQITSLYFKYFIVFLYYNYL
jgi:hypothetical protein